jgi:NAD+ diphosphatase
MRFIPGITPPATQKKTALFFCVKGDLLLVKHKTKSVTPPSRAELAGLGIMPLSCHYLGILAAKDCYAALLPAEAQVPAGMGLFSLRELYGLMNEQQFAVAVRAYLIVQWDRDHRYCGRCGSVTKTAADERAMICQNCGLKGYPRIAPAVIVAVTKGNRLLLARAKRFKLNIYSVLAGFVEPGESLEQCIEREVREEVGIEIANIAYFGSQPWPFPNSLMVAFTARYASGRLSLDDKEIEHAAWFKADELPRLPPPMSIARSLINWFIRTSGT